MTEASEEDVARFFAENGLDYQRVVEEERSDHLAHVPLLWVSEPLSMNMGVPPGGYASIRDGTRDIAVLKGESGRFVLVEYGDRFEQATKHLHRSIEGADNNDFLSCISDGISSIEAFLSYSTRRYGEGLPESIPTAKGSRRLTFDEKIDEWLPKMTRGRKLDKSGRNWSDFKELREIRDAFQAHPKTSVYGVSFRELCRRLNLFRTGIAGLLIDLHAVLRTSYVPEIVFRYAYLPDIEYVEEPE
ncbi:MAG: hypothetical protein M3272_08285 [Actinomycetota bacterium]|nr:hypothetical protein [Actinomycetota bacterium]